MKTLQNKNNNTQLTHVDQYTASGRVEASQYWLYNPYSLWSVCFVYINHLPARIEYSQFIHLGKVNKVISTLQYCATVPECFQHMVLAGQKI